MSYSVLNDLAGSHEGVRREKAVTTHPTGMTTGPSQIQPDTQREDQQSTDWTRRHQRTNREGGQSRNEARRERATPKQPHTPKAKTSKATEEREQQKQRPTGTRPLFWLCFGFFVAFCVVGFLCCVSQWIVTAAGLCTGSLPVHFCSFHLWWRLFVCIN